MTGAEVAQGLARGIHVGATMSVFGAMVFHAIVAPPATLRVPAEQMREIAARITLLARLSLAAAILAASVWLLMETMDVAGEGGVDQILTALRTVLLELRFGWLLMIRLGLLALAVVVFGRGRHSWPRIGAAGLAACAVALQAGLGHGASMGGTGGWSLTVVEAIHLLAAGAWLGGLMPLFLLVSALPPATSVTALRRFSRLGIACVAVLAATIVIQGWVLIGGLPGLVGTDYGLVALLKATAFCVLLGFAAANRFRYTPALAGLQSPDANRRRLRRSIAGETLVGLFVILAAGILLTLPPAMHQQPDWPFSYQFSLATQVDPDLRNETLLGATEAIAAFALLCFALVWRRMRWIGVGAAALLSWWAAPHLSLLLVPAYPTSFYRSTSGFTAASIAHGATLFSENCAVCHGAEGRGDGPQSRNLPIPPADLTAAHLFEHSDGELFWWLTHGVEGPRGILAMPGFGDRLDADERWNLIDYVRAHNAGLAMAERGQWPRPMPAPDLTVTMGSGNIALSALRGQTLRIVAHRGDGNDLPPPLPPGDLAITTIPLAPGSDGWAAYAVVAGTSAEQLAGTAFLVDSNGWLRAVFRPAGPAGWPDPADFLAAARAAEAHPIETGDESQRHHQH